MKGYEDFVVLFPVSPADTQQSIVYVRSAHAATTLYIRWAVPCVNGSYQTKYSSMISHLLMVAGLGSPSAVLKAQGWINDPITARPEDGDVKDGYEFLLVYVNLTKLGWGEYARSVCYVDVMI